MINADNPKSVLCALIVDSQWRMRPSTNDLAGPEYVRGAIDGRGREPLDQRDDGLGTLLAAPALRSARYPTAASRSSAASGAQTILKAARA